MHGGAVSARDKINSWQFNGDRNLSPSDRGRISERNMLEMVGAQVVANFWSEEENLGKP